MAGSTGLLLPASSTTSSTASPVISPPEGVIAAAERAMVPEDLAEGLLREHAAGAGQFARPAAESLAHGAQTPDGARDLEGTLRGLAGWNRTGHRCSPASCSVENLVA